LATKNPQEPFTRISVSEAKEKIDTGDAVFIDVREPGEYAEYHATGVTLIPLNTVFGRTNDLPDDKDLVFICKMGSRSALACEYAAAAGKTRLFNVEGGTDQWRDSGLPMG